jgi:hypothetical protein
MDRTHEEIRRHADECRRMARSAIDPHSRAAWNNLAERWLRCEELERAMATAQAAVETYPRIRKMKQRPDRSAAP